MISTAFASTVLTFMFSAQLVQRPVDLRGRVRVSGQTQTVPFATIRLLQVGREIDRQVAGADGRFQFPGVGVGSYTLEVVYPGYEAGSVQFEVPGTRYDLDVELKPAVSGIRPMAPTVSVYEAMVPKHAQQEYARGLERRENKNCDQALPHFEKAVQAFPQYASAYNELALCYVEAHQFDEAETAFLKSIRFGSSIYPHINLADLYLKENRPEDACKGLESAIRTHPQEGDLYYALANVYFVQGRLDEAENAGLAADSRDHRIPDLHVLLAKIYERQGDPVRVREQLEIFLKEAPKNPNAPRIRELLGLK
jgi:tetratricopeptide (TPR) repeat protein